MKAGAGWKALTCGHLAPAPPAPGQEAPFVRGGGTQAARAGVPIRDACGATAPDC